MFIGKNTAERCTQKFKNNFISILCGVHPDFPLHLADRLLPQAEMTLNMFRPCRFNHKISACTAIESGFSYNHAPLIPLGHKVKANDHSDI